MAKSEEYIQMRLFFFLFVMSISFGSLCAQRADFNTIGFGRADSVAFANGDQDLSNLPALAFILTASLSTEVEKFRSIYTWVCSNIDYDYGYYLKNHKNRWRLQKDSVALANWNKAFLPKVFRKLQKEQKTVCTGYAYLLSELSKLAGIDCRIVDGYGRTVNANVKGQSVPNHSWNAVRLDKRWYLCDPTWSSGGVNAQDGRFVQDYNDGYFLASPELFIKSHYPLDSTWRLIETGLTLNEFVAAPLVYKHSFSHQIVAVSPKALMVPLVRKEALLIALKLSDKNDVNKLTLRLDQGSSSSYIKPNVKTINNETYELSHIFESLGKYDVHVMLERDYIVSYTVNVKRDK